MTSEPAIRIVLVDDHPLFRAGVRVILDARPDLLVVGEAADGESAIATIGDTRPDVVLTDVEMRPMNGAQLTKALLSPEQVARTGYAPRVVMLTTFDIDERASLAMRYGASGILFKSAMPDELCNAIRSAHRGDAVVTPRQITQLLSPDNHRPVPVPPAYRCLTEKEHDVVRALLSGANNQEVAASLFLSESTVKTHVSSILRKLALRDRVQLVLHAIEHGYPRGG